MHLDGPEGYDYVVFKGGSRDKPPMALLLAAVFATFQALFPADCQGDCALHVAMTGKYYKLSLWGLRQPTLPQLPTLALSSRWIAASNALARHAFGVTNVSDCVAFTWRAVWGTSRFHDDASVSSVLGDIVSGLQAKRASCVVLSTDFTVFKEPQGGLTCADIHNSVGRHNCPRFDRVRKALLATLGRQFRLVIAAKATREFLALQRQERMDPDMVNSCLDLGLLSQVGARSQGEEKKKKRKKRRKKKKRNARPLFHYFLSWV